MKSNLKKASAILLSVALLFTAAACGPAGPAKTPAAETTAALTTGAAQAPPQKTATQGTPTSAESGEKDKKGLGEGQVEKLDFATEFELTRYAGGFTKFTVTTDPDREFLIVPEGKQAPQDLSEQMIVLQQPLKKTCFNSTGMVSLVDAIGGLDQIASVGYKADSWHIPDVKERVEKGKIQFSGGYRTPDFETLTASGVQIVIDTTMLSGYPEIIEKYHELKIPLVIENSSKEGHPLGRVEWVKLFGALLGLDQEAQEYFTEQKKKVEAVTSVEKTNQTVAMFYMSAGAEGKVYARNGGDYMATMIGLAGGNYIMADVSPEKTGTTATTFEDIYARCKDADYLFYVNFARKFDSLEALIDAEPLFGEFKAVKEGRTYVTAASFTQSIAAVGNIIEDMHRVLLDPGIEQTDSLIKLK